MHGDTVFERLTRWAVERANEPALIFLGDGETEAARWSFFELHRRAAAIASMVRQGNGVGAPVALLYPPGLDFAAALFGCFYAGAIAVPAPFNPRTRMTERVRSILDSVCPALLLTRDAQSCEKFQAAGETWLETGSIPPSESGPGPLHGVVPALLQYTSGSTGTPKGVVIEHAALSANFAAQRDAFAVGDKTVIVSWLPMFHDMGLVGNLLLAVHSGRPCVLMPPLAFLQSPVRWLKAITKYGGTLSGGPNFAFELCATRIEARQLEGLDLSSWCAAFCGAEPVRARTMENFAAMFAPAGFSARSLTPCYGMAEATLLIAAADLDHAPMAAADGRVSCGRAFGCELQIVDPETTDPAPPGDMGEVWLRGPSIARGYWNDPGATMPVFGVSSSGLGEGWFRTGDRGYLGNGELYLAGRIKDTLIHRGANIDPEDVERAASQASSGLSSICAAFAVEIDDRENIVVVQEVERKALPLADPASLIAAIVDAIAAQMGLRLYDCLLLRPGAVPRTTSGKIQRSRCRELYLQGALQQAGASTGHRLLLKYQGS